jgi:DNA helicase-2/ATP-dependent DNA helicase PcrA
MIDYDRELNEQQRRVVMETGGPLLVIAGAGSGKTRTLTYRVARLIESGARPERILLATFTNKASRSMLSRVNQLLAQETERLWGGGRFIISPIGFSGLTVSCSVTIATLPSWTRKTPGSS